MYYCYGKVKSQLGQIPAGTDTAQAYRVFTAGEHPIQIIGGSYFGGDGGEAMSLYLASPDFVSDGSIDVGTDGQVNGLVCLTNSLVGGTYNGQRRGSVYMGGNRFDSSVPKNGQGTIMPEYWIVPPYYQIVVATNTAVNTTAVSVVLLGMELIKP